MLKRSRRIAKAIVNISRSRRAVLLGLLGLSQVRQLIEESEAGQQSMAPDDVESFRSYDEIRGYKGTAEKIRIVRKDIAGIFRRDGSAVGSEDNGGTIIVDASGRRWRRQTAGAWDFRWFEAKADGIADDTVALNEALKAAPAGTVFEQKDCTFLLLGPVEIRRAVVIRSGIYRTRAAVAPAGFNPDAMRSQHIFTTPPIPPGSSIDRIAFDGCICECSGEAGANVFFFQSASTVNSAYVVGRTDFFSMKKCVGRNIKLVHTYGKGLVCAHNSAVNAGRWTQNTTRNFVFLINQYIGPTTNVDHLDVSPSDATIGYNETSGFGGGVCVHHHFNNKHPDRRVMTARVFANRIAGWSVAQAAENPLSRKSGGAGIYFGSVRDIECYDNDVKNHADMGIDFEYCINMSIHGNRLHNGGLSFLWNGCDNATVYGNEFSCDSSDGKYAALLRQASGGVKSGHAYRENIFRNLSPSKISAKVSIMNSSNDLVVELNEFWDVSLSNSVTGYHLDTVIRGNKFHVTVDRGVLPGRPPLVEVDNTGRLEVSDNQLDMASGVTQAAGPVAVKVVMRRAKRGNISYSPRSALIKNNRLTGFSKSMQIGVVGVMPEKWSVELVKNQYDGALESNIPAAAFVK